MLVPFLYRDEKVRYHIVPEPLPKIWILHEESYLRFVKIKVDDHFEDCYDRKFRLEKLTLTENPIYVEN